MILSQLKKDLASLADPERASTSARFFKTGPGEYGEGDKFLGITVPQQRQVAKKHFATISLEKTLEILKSHYHEHRLTAAFILVYKYEHASNGKTADITLARQIYDTYLNNRKHINNWDLVDTSTPQIIGNYMLHHPSERKKLYSLAESRNLWDRRIAIMATHAFIKANQFTDTLDIAEILLNDSHDLIQKATGWMLREIGNRDLSTEETFLKKHYRKMPRTMLRYAIEKFSHKKRKFYMEQPIQ